MKTVDLLILDIKTGCRQSISVTEPVDEKYLKDNALKRFGLTIDDVDITSRTIEKVVEKDVEVITGRVKDTLKVFTLIIF